MLCWPGRSRGVEQGLDDEIDKVTGSESAMPEKDDGRKNPTGSLRDLFVTYYVTNWVGWNYGRKGEAADSKHEHETIMRVGRRYGAVGLRWVFRKSSVRR